MVGMGTNNEEITIVTKPISMLEMITEDTLSRSLDAAIKLLDSPTTVDDGFPFLAEPVHLTRFPAIFK